MSDPEFEGFSIQPAIDNVIQHLGTLEWGKPVAIVAAFPAHFPLLLGKEEAFRKALQGLLSLMLHSTVRDEIRIRVQLVPVDSIAVPLEQRDHLSSAESGPWCLLSISDQEGGFEAGEERTIGGKKDVPSSVPDYREAQEQIEAMGGVIWTEEPEPSSTIIWIALPLLQASQQAPDISSVQEILDEDLQGQELREKSILTLTDDDALSMELTGALTDAGYQILECPAASDLLRIARSEQPDLVILDLQTRDPDALDLAKLLKKDAATSKIPVLFLTTIADAEGGYRLDTARYLVKSEGTGAMLATIHTALASGVPPASRVMVVEADDALREQMIFHVQSYGHPVVESRSAEEALALVERTRIGVVLANANLAQARDYWLIRQIKSIYSEIRIYILAEELSEKEGKQAILRGATGFGDTGRLPELLEKMSEEESEED